MPRYDYQCPECEEIEEEVHRMDEKPIIVCTKCGEEKVKMLPRRTSFQFPGIVGRWMEDNYEKLRGDRLTEREEDVVTEPNHGYNAGKDFNTR